MNNESIDWDEIVKAAQEMRIIPAIAPTRAALLRLKMNPKYQHTHREAARDIEALCEENTGRVITKEDCLNILISGSKARAKVESAFEKFKISLSDPQPE